MGNVQNQSWFEKFCVQTHERVYEKGYVFREQGAPSSTVGLIISGEAAAFSYSINGDETWLSEYSQGQFIGLIPLIEKESSNFEIRAVTKLVVRTLPYSTLLELMRNETSFSQAVATDLAAQLQSSMTELISINTVSVKGRICAELIRLALPIGIDPDRHIIRPSPVFVDLARRLNSSRETVSRTVSELQKKGILAREPGALIVESPDRLKDAIEYI